MNAAVQSRCARADFALPPRGRPRACDRRARRFLSVSRSSFAVQAKIGHLRSASLGAGFLVAKDDNRNTIEVEEIRRIATGDSLAFQRLIDREAPRLLRFAQGMLGSLDEAEDVVQDTLIRLWENAARWTPDAKVGTWLHRVCYNRSIDRLRRRRAFVDEAALEDVPDEFGSGRCGARAQRGDAFGPRGDRSTAGAPANRRAALPYPGARAARGGGGDERQRGGVRVDAVAGAAAIAAMAHGGGS